MKFSTCLAAHAVAGASAGPLAFNSTGMKLGTVVSCGGSGDIGSGLVAVLDPPAPCAGQSMTLSLDFTASREVSRGTSIVSGSFSGIKLPSSTNPLCTSEGGKVDCPIAAGANHFDIPSDVPAGTPKGGQLIIQQQWVDADTSETVICVAYLLATC